MMMTANNRPRGSSSISSSSSSIMLLQWLWIMTAALAVLAPYANAFAAAPPIQQWMPLAAARTRTTTTRTTLEPPHSIPRMAMATSTSADDQGKEEEEEDKEQQHPMSNTSRLSHVMLQVPSVDKTVKYWTDKGGSIRISRNKPGTSSNGEAELMSAFIELGHQGSAKAEAAEEGGKNYAPCFALELVNTPENKQENYRVGNCISYIGVSMLLQFQNNLLGPIIGEKPLEQGDEPNGIPIKSSASAPGDFLSRFALRSRDLVATLAFYSTILGMDAMGIDNDMVCLRYEKNMQDFPGVPTTLVFEAASSSSSSTQDEDIIDKGDCFDHLAVVTKFDIEELHRRIQESEYSIFMNPTDMFGKRVMGVLDPNGYKVVIASE